MSISIISRNIEVTPAIKDYIEKRFKGLSKYTPGEPVIEVEIGKENNRHKQGEIFEAKVNVTTSLGKKYYAISTKEDLYEAVDDIRSEVARVLAGAKGKNLTLFRRGAQRIKNILKGFRS